MSDMARIEKFTVSELIELRKELMKLKVDSWQTAEIVSSFLAGRGYGVNANAMRQAVPSLEILAGTPENIQAVLETVAYVM